MTLLTGFAFKLPAQKITLTFVSWGTGLRADQRSAINKARIAQEEIDRIAQKAEADAEKLALEEQQLLESSLLNFEVEETIDETRSTIASE